MKRVAGIDSLGAAKTDKSATMRSLERSLDVIDVLARADGPQRLVDVARSANLHPATALRILSVLERRQFVISEGQRYRLGIATLVGSYGFMRDNVIVTRAKPYMQELAAATRLSVALYFRYGFHRVQVARVNGKNPLRYELPNGRLLPLNLGGGKVFVASMDRSEFDQYVTTLPPEMLTVRGRRFTPEDLWNEGQEIRRQGYHVSREERAAGTVSLSVPVKGHDDAMYGVLALLSPIEAAGDIDPEALVSEAIRASHAIGNLPW